MASYTILDKIGAGGMGQVFKAQHRRMERLVAIKMLPPAMTKDAAALARFQREVEAAAKLRHPNIVAADDAARPMAFTSWSWSTWTAKTFRRWSRRTGRSRSTKPSTTSCKLPGAWSSPTAKGVVHRDIKPANLLLDKKEVVKILDMGLARIEQADGGAQAELTGTGTIMGTVDYMSPEQALNTKHADQRADIYSLGMSLYYLLAGKAAYGGETAMEKLMAHQNQPIPSLQDVQTTVSKQLEAVFKKMVAKKIEDRYQTMSEVVEALEGLGYGGSSTGGKGDVASTIDLSSADRKKLASQAKKKPLGSITEVVASEKTKHLILKIVGGSFGTIIAPILVFYLIRHLEKQEHACQSACGHCIQQRPCRLWSWRRIRPPQPPASMSRMTVRPSRWSLPSMPSRLKPDKPPGPSIWARRSRRPTASGCG